MRSKGYKNESISANEIAEYEKRNNISIPQVYKSLLVKHNGANLYPLGMDIKDFGGFVVDDLFKIDENDTYLDIAKRVKGMMNAMPPEFFPFGLTSAGDRLLIGTKGKYKDKIYLWWMEGGTEEQPYYENIYFVANSWNDFINNLHEDQDDENDDEETPLIDLFDKGKYEDIIGLMNSGWDVNTVLENGQSALQRVAIFNRIDIAKLLLQKGAKTNGTISFAITNENYEMIELLIKSKADLNEIDEDQNTLLHLSIMEVKIPAIRLLLEYDVDVNAKNDIGYTPLKLCNIKIDDGYSELKEIIPLLISKGAIE